MIISAKFSLFLLIDTVWAQGAGRIWLHQDFSKWTAENGWFDFGIGQLIKDNLRGCAREHEQWVNSEGPGRHALSERSDCRGSGTRPNVSCLPNASDIKRCAFWTIELVSDWLELIDECNDFMWRTSKRFREWANLISNARGCVVSFRSSVETKVAPAACPNTTTSTFQQNYENVDEILRFERRRIVKIL